jgi:hypothetical protein
MSMKPQRPGVVTFIGVILYIQAFLAAVSAIVLLAFRDDIQDFLEGAGSPLSDGSVTGTVIGEAIAAILLFIVGAGIMSGSRGMRLFVAIVEAVVMGIAVYTMVTHHAGAYLYRGFFTLLVGVFVLWALYGNDRSEAFFEGSPS